MIEASVLSRLEQILGSDFDLAKTNVIFTTDSGYDVFDNYVITKLANTVKVEKRNQDPKFFSGTRSALSWCIADKFNIIKLSDEIVTLDEKRQRLRNDVDFSSRLVSRFKDPNARETAALKLESKKRLLATIEEGLGKCAKSAKYWQLRGFKDEIERIRHNTPTRNDRSTFRVASR